MVDRFPLVETLLLVWFREATRLQLITAINMEMALELCIAAAADKQFLNLETRRVGLFQLFR